MEGVVVKVLAGVITVNTPNGLINCTVKGRLKLDDYPTAGDVVWVEVIDDLGVVTKIYPRRNLLDRPRIANVDQIFIFMAAASPEPNAYLVDRLLVIAEYWKLKAIIGFNKTDLKKCELPEIYRDIGYDVYEFSLLEDGAIDVLREALKDKTTVLAGPSGVGKTTFVNKLLGEQRVTADVSEKTQRGRHTTRVVELLRIPEGGYIADTPAKTGAKTRRGLCRRCQQVPEISPVHGSRGCSAEVHHRFRNQSILPQAPELISQPVSGFCPKPSGYL
jgi:ribosome biogenesis GTPase